MTIESWTEAIKSAASEEWQDLLLEAANRYSEKVMQRSLERFKTWNEVAGELRPIVRDLVRQKTQLVVRTHQLPDVFSKTVEWDVMHLCLEAEFADVYPPGFFASQAYWYVQGHFPCGWVGSFPEGNLIVF